jgi:hypothetical protein
MVVAMSTSLPDLTVMSCPDMIPILASNEHIAFGQDQIFRCKRRIYDRLEQHGFHECDLRLVSSLPLQNILIQQLVSDRCHLSATTWKDEGFGLNKGGHDPKIFAIEPKERRLVRLFRKRRGIFS